MKAVRFLIANALIVGLSLIATPAVSHVAGSGADDNFMVTRHFTGAWDQVDQESQGILLEVIEQTDGARRAAAYWFTYGSDRKSAWYLGIGDLVDERIEFELFESSDVGFMEAASGGNDTVQSIGTMSIVFENCDTGFVSFETTHEEVGSGSFDISRVSEIMNTHCSGGISDDMHSNVDFGEQRLELTSAREGISGEGHATYNDYPGHMEFEVEVEGLVDGDYQLYVGMQDRGTLTVENGHGKLEFRSPGETGIMLLTFDPRGMDIEIHDNQGVVLSSFDNRFEQRQYGHHGGGGSGPGYDCDNMHGPGLGMHGGMRDCVDGDDFVEIEVDLTNTTALPDARGEAEWKMNSERVEFSVEIEDVPVGVYSLRVGGTEVGSIDAREMRFGDVFGRIRFRDPESFGGFHLDFEPRGQKIEVMQESTVILETEFPES